MYMKKRAWSALGLVDKISPAFELRNSGDRRDKTARGAHFFNVLRRTRMTTNHSHSMRLAGSCPSGPAWHPTASTGIPRTTSALATPGGHPPGGGGAHPTIPGGAGECAQLGLVKTGDWIALCICRAVRFD
jgi:hypothetical protein